MQISPQIAYFWKHWNEPFSPGYHTYFNDQVEATTHILKELADSFSTRFGVWNLWSMWINSFFSGSPSFFKSSNLLIFVFPGFAFVVLVMVIDGGVCSRVLASFICTTLSPLPFCWETGVDFWGIFTVDFWGIFTVDFWGIFTGEDFWETFSGGDFWETFTGDLLEIFIGEDFWGIFAGGDFWGTFTGDLLEIFTGGDFWGMFTASLRFCCENLKNKN